MDIPLRNRTPLVAARYSSAPLCDGLLPHRHLTGPSEVRSGSEARRYFHTFICHLQPSNLILDVSSAAEEDFWNGRV